MKHLTGIVKLAVVAMIVAAASVAVFAHGSRASLAAHRRAAPAPTADRASEHFSGPITLKSNRAAARADARYLVSLVTLPRGSRQDSSYRPHRLTRLESVLTSRLYAAEFLVPKGAANPQAYVSSHPPGGVRSNGTIGGGSSGSFTLEYDFPQIHGRVFARVLEVTFTRQSNGSTRVLAEAQSNWMLPRPESTMVPRTAVKVMLTTTVTRRSHSSRTGSRSITAHAAVHKLIRLVNALEIGQDVITNCPAEATGSATRSLQMEFIGAGRQELAAFTASLPLRGLGGTGWECNPFTIKLASGARAYLTGTRFLARVQKLTGFKIR